MKKYSKYFLLGGAVSISVLVFIFRGDIARLQSLGYFGIFLISLIGSATIILPVPSFLSALVGGAFLNPLLVALFSSVGATLGELTGYMAGLGGDEFVKHNKRIKMVENWMIKYGAWTIFVLAMIPNPLFDIAGIIAGASRMPVYKYLLVVWAGKMIKYLGISYLGAGSLVMFNKFV